MYANEEEEDIQMCYKESGINDFKILAAETLK
jgi:hypothetical protein